MKIIFNPGADVTSDKVVIKKENKMEMKHCKFNQSHLTSFHNERDIKNKGLGPYTQRKLY